MQYFPDEAFIDAKIAELASESENKSDENHVANGHKPTCPIVTSPSDQKAGT